MYALKMHFMPAQRDFVPQAHIVGEAKSYSFSLSCWTYGHFPINDDLDTG